MSRGDLLGDSDQGVRQACDLRRALGLQSCRGRGEEHFRLEHEAVADDPDVGIVAQDLAQAAEELRAVASQLLHPGGQGRR